MNGGNQGARSAPHRGGQHWAVVAIADRDLQMVGVEPLAYLINVTTRIVAGHPNTRIDELLPWAYPIVQDLKSVA